MDTSTLAALVVGMQSQSAKLDAGAALARKANERDAAVLTLLEAAGVGTAASSNPRGTGALISRVA